MTDTVRPVIDGICVTIDAEAVRVSSARPLRMLSSAVLGGGFAEAHDIVNVHVDKDYDGDRPEDELAAFAARHGAVAGAVGLMTAAETQFAALEVAQRDGLTVAAVVSMGLSNVASAGVTPPAPPPPGTINAIVLIEGLLAPAAMVNAVITATEAKALTLVTWDVRTPAGDLAAGTSTDAVVIACTGTGEALQYAGTATTVGWLIARTVRDAVDRICREKCARDGGRFGW